MQEDTGSVWAGVYLPRLKTDRLLRAGREGEALAVYARQANSFVLTGVDAQGAALGLHAGMALADARAIHPRLTVIEAEPEADARVLDCIGAWCERFTPIVVIDAPDGLLLDITGCAHLFGGEEAMCDEIVARLAVQGFGARIALGPTPGAAWALARYGLSKRSRRGSPATLASLPIEALRLDDDAATLLRRLGLKTIGQLIEAPRAPFAARAGQRALRRLDQALGRASEALCPRRPAPPVFALRRFLEPLFSAEAILIAAQSLFEEVVEKLDQRGAGVRACTLHLFGVDGRDRLIEVGASRPERDVKALMRLMREKLSRAAENLDAEFGIEAARLDIVALERIEASPRTLVADEDLCASPEKIAGIVDVLSARLGARRVLAPKLRDAHAPERAGGWGANSQAADLSARPPPPAPAPQGGGGCLSRPLTLFSRAQPIDAIATVPDGPPIRFRWRRVLREVARAEGPERIAGDWLKREPTRDYYRVEDQQGRRYWLYRQGFYGEGEAPRWFVHGLFA